MGFFDFLKKKRQAQQTMDIPPSPTPAIPDFNSPFSPAPGADFKIEVPNFDIPKDPSWDNFEQPKQEVKLNQEPLISAPPTEQVEQPHPVELRIEEHIEEKHEEPIHFEPHDEPTQSLPKRVINRKPHDGPIYLSLEQCEEIIADLNFSKNNLKKIDEATMRLVNIKQQSDKSADILKKDIEAAHHNLMKIDRIIFRR